MKSKKYLLAIDEGTTGQRAVLFSARDMRAVTSSSTPVHSSYPSDGWVEQDAEQIYRNEMLCIRRLFESGKYSASEVIAIGITNQRESVVIWDKKTGKPLAPCVSWQCRRTADECENLKKQGYLELVKQKTGLVLDAYFSATKLKWLLDNTAGAREKARRGELLAGTLDSYLVYRLTKGAKHVTDVTNASRTMLFNIHEMKWDDELLELFGIPREILPEVTECTGDFGSVEVDGVSIPIRGIAGDQQASLIGQACFEKGDVKCTYGTGAFILANIGDVPQITDSPLITTVAYSIAGKTAYAFEGSVFNAGSVINWLESVGIISNAKESEILASSVPDSGGAYLIPAFTGMGAPYWDMNCRAAIVGITRATKKEHIVRAGLESIALRCGEVFDMMSEALGSPLGALRADGGVSNNRLLLGLQSDIICAEVRRSIEIESTALGAAYLASIGSGRSDLDKIKVNHSYADNYLPTKVGSKIEKLKDGWKKAVNSMLS